MLSAYQLWNPDEWETYCRSLLEHTHGPLNVHKIPATHRGDYGIDYYCTKDLVAYQCYAVEEPVDISTRADRQKTKITTDLTKIIKNQADISKIFLNKQIKHWFLLVPKHDSKEVNLHCSKKTTEIRSKEHPALDEHFEVGIKDLSCFPAAANANGIASLSNVNLSVPEPSQEELESWVTGSSDLVATATHKLQKRATADELEEAVAQAIKSLLQGTALIDALRKGSPEIHEKIMSAINSRVKRLKLAGSSGGTNPNNILVSELDGLAEAMRKVAPNISDGNVDDIAMGTIADWIMRCPLDFPDAQ